MHKDVFVYIRKLFHSALSRMQLRGRRAVPRDKFVDNASVHLEPVPSSQSPQVTPHAEDHPVVLPSVPSPVAKAELPEIAAGGQTPARETLDLLEDCVSLFDEIDGHIASLDPPAQEIAKHVCDRLQEILERAGMEVIAEDGVFNRRLHRPEKKGSGNNGDDSQWHARILSPGFQLDRRVYRKARVSLRPGGDGATTGQGSGA